MFIQRKIIILGFIFTIIPFLLGLSIEFVNNKQDTLLLISYGTYQSCLFTISGSAFFALIMSYIIYDNEKTTYLNKTEKFLISICIHAKITFNHIHKADNLLQENILSQENTFNIKTLISYLEIFTNELTLINPQDFSPIRQRKLFLFYNELIQTIHNDIMYTIQKQFNEIKSHLSTWKLYDSELTIINEQNNTSTLITEEKKITEKKLQQSIATLSWQLNHIIEQSFFAISLFYTLKNKRDKLQNQIDFINKQSSSYQENFQKKPPQINEQILSEHYIRIINFIGNLEDLINNHNHPIILGLASRPDLYLYTLSTQLNQIKCYKYEMEIIYPNEDKLIFYTNEIINNLSKLINEFRNIQIQISNQPEIQNELKQINIQTFTPDNNILLENILQKLTSYNKLQEYAKNIIDIIQSKDFKSRLTIKNSCS